MNPISQYEPELSSVDANALFSYMQSGGWLTEHRYTHQFEQEIAKFVGAKHCIAVSSGTAALTTCLYALGVGPGDEVVVPNVTMAATPNSAVILGAKVVFVDVEPSQISMDPDHLRSAISSKTKAVIHVSLNGRAGYLEEVNEICSQYNLPLIEDAAQSLGSFIGTKHLGTVGKCGIFSFSSPKIITTGQGGAIVTNDSQIADSIRKIKNFGRNTSGGDEYESIGFNFKFTDLQATVGLSQFSRIHERMLIKKRLWSLYQQRLSNIPGLQLLHTNTKYVTPWFIDIFTKKRDALAKYLLDREISTRNFYPALNEQPAFKIDGSFPVSHLIAANGVWLPSSFKLTEFDVNRICDEIQRFFMGNQ